MQTWIFLTELVLPPCCRRTVVKYIQTFNFRKPHRHRRAELIDALSVSPETAVDESSLIRLVERYFCAKSSRAVALTVRGECDARNRHDFRSTRLCKR